MVGIVLVTHGGIAREMLEATRSIVGPVEQMEAVSTDPDETGDIRERIRAAIEATEKGDGVLLVTDMFGGTPANVALSFLNEKKIEVVTVDASSNAEQIEAMVGAAGERAEDASTDAADVAPDAVEVEEDLQELGETVGPAPDEPTGDAADDASEDAFEESIANPDGLDPDEVAGDHVLGDDLLDDEPIDDAALDGDALGGDALDETGRDA